MLEDTSWVKNLAWVFIVSIVTSHAKHQTFNELLNFQWESQSLGSEKNESESNFKVYDLTNGEDLAPEIFYVSAHAS